MKGVYQHCAKKHLHRYATECYYHYINRSAVLADDTLGAHMAIKGADGLRLTYRKPVLWSEGAKA